MDEIQLSSYLVFTSRSAKLMSSDDLALMLNQAYQMNELNQITGMLLYMEIRLISKLEGRFIQLIEGNETRIQSLYEKIRSDKRHDNILLLASGQQNSTCFNNWSMSYSGQQPQHIAYQTLEDNLFRSEQFLEGKGPTSFLKTFYDYNQQLQKEYALQTLSSLSLTARD